MKNQQEKLIVAGMIIAIIVLAGVLVWLSAQKKDSVGVSLPKEFAKELHVGVQTEYQINQALLEDLDDIPAPDENREQFFLLQNVARSYQRELEWLKEKESASFEILSKTENNLTAQSALQKEISYYVLFQYLQLLNASTIENVSQATFDIDSSIQTAEQELADFPATFLLPSSKLQEFAQDSGLTEQQVGQGIQETLHAFFEFKKNEFEQSVTRYEKAVIAHQISEWKFLLQAVAAQTN